nr:tumor necrosis factor receptor superfamily member 13C [Vulpes vulpes]
MGSDRRGARGPRGRSPRGRDGPAPTRCVQAECFDPLVRNCVACKLLRTPEPRPGKSRPTQPAGQQGCSPGKEGEGPPPGNLREPQATRDGGGAVTGLMGGCKRSLLRAAAPPGAPDPRPHPHPHPRETLDNVIIVPPGPLDATAPVWPPAGEDPANTPPAHSVPVPATELGSTELVTTKTAGPEQQ